MEKLTYKDKHKGNVGNHLHTNIYQNQQLRGEHKCRILEMHLKLKGQQLKLFFNKTNTELVL